MRRLSRRTPANNNPACRAGRFVAVTVIGALIAGPAPSHAQQADPSALEDLQSEIGTSIERRKQLAAEATTLAREIDQMRTDLVRTATRVRDRERTVSASEEKLEGLTAAQEVVTAQLLKSRLSLAGTLAALQRLSRDPPPALAVRPSDALGALRSALLLSAATPELKQQAIDLRRQLDELAILRGQIEQEQQTLKLASLSLTEEQTALEALLSRKRAKQQALAQKAAREQATLDRLSREARDLKDLIARLEARAATRLPPTRPDPAKPSPTAPAQAKPGPSKPGQTQPFVKPGPSPSSPQVAALTPTPGFTPSITRRFSRAHGLLRLPAEGRPIRFFGSKDDLGDKARGITIETRGGAQITAPFDGKVVFSGPFRRYGQLLIISVGEGYHVLLAGMTRINAIVGQNLLAGEPVGTMPPVGQATTERAGAARQNETRGTEARPKPSLYMEFRKNGEPIDPRPWLAVNDRKARG